MQTDYDRDAKHLQPDILEQVYTDTFCQVSLAPTDVGANLVYCMDSRGRTFFAPIAHVYSGRAEPVALWGAHANSRQWVEETNALVLSKAQAWCAIRRARMN